MMYFFLELYSFQNREGSLFKFYFLSFLENYMNRSHLYLFIYLFNFLSLDQILFVLRW